MGKYMAGLPTRSNTYATIGHRCCDHCGRAPKDCVYLPAASLLFTLGSPFGRTVSYTTCHEQSKSRRYTLGSWAHHSFDGHSHNSQHAVQRSDDAE